MPANQQENERYSALGFMCGLEIHQRLATSEKLFCPCSTSIPSKDEKPIADVSRYQKAVAGELGAIDVSAEFEEQKNREFVYRVYKDNTCLVDLDEEPPHSPNREAVAHALSFAKAMNMHIVHEIQPMRKAVVDGSDPSAFQRTMLVALNGAIDVDGHRINIPSMFLEEESSGIESADANTAVYNTDRLGIPLIEIDTDPHIPNPRVAKLVALQIGTVLRISGAVQRGIGSIRQDVNMSIKDGARVEIKGVQELDLIDKFLDNEILRQQKLIEIRERLKKAEATVGVAKDVTHIFANTNIGIISNQLKKHGVAVAFSLRGFKGVLGTEVNPNKRLGTEISDYAKMAGVQGLIHSDEDMNKYGFSESELVSLRKELGVSANDSFILIAGGKSQAPVAANHAIWRAKYALVGVPKETRAANDNSYYTTKFMRPLPSGSRMYPETDARPILVTGEMVAKAEQSAPNLDNERKYLSSIVKNKALVEQLIMSPRLLFFKRTVQETGADPEFVANVIIQKLTELRRTGVEVEMILDDGIMAAFKAYNDGTITKQAIDELLKALAKRDEPVMEIIARERLERIKGKGLIKLVDEAMKESGGKGIDEARKIVMSRHRLVVDGSELNSILVGRMG
ncbi:MAG: Glu-tRNA(Gln) amidotransferase subunit GatE [Candidatus Micrarchaeota archaeon]|nr:Glu-tRNA(Gln) amidotransferase subunit GatE [Candidatus Micrarchaeota archaeon]